MSYATVSDLQSDRLTFSHQLFNLVIVGSNANRTLDSLGCFQSHDCKKSKDKTNILGTDKLFKCPHCEETFEKKEDHASCQKKPEGQNNDQMPTCRYYAAEKCRFGKSGQNKHGKEYHFLWGSEYASVPSGLKSKIRQNTELSDAKDTHRALR